MTIRELDETYIAGTYNRFPITLVSGKGSIVLDDKGKEYIDMGSGIGVTAFGFGDEVWKEAVKAQLDKLQHTSNLYYTEPCARLAALLCQKTGMKKVFFSNSGAEANECAIKAARKYAAEKKGSQAYTIVTLKNSFHGRTLTTLAATGQAHYHELYQPLTSGFESIEAGDLAALEALHKKKPVAAVFIECIQGEGGVVPLAASFVRELSDYCKDNDILFMVDEVQTGNGRTGQLYAYMNYGVTPDIVSTAKGLAGGLPMGATLLGDKVKDVFGFGDHGSTFGGNPVCAAAALSILERLDETLLSAVRAKGDYLKNFFMDKEGIESVSGLGLMLGLKTKRKAQDVVKSTMEHGVLCLTAKEKVRLLPALTITQEALSHAATIILEACQG